MISRLTTQCLAELYVNVFRATRNSESAYSKKKIYYIDGTKIHDFLFVNNYADWVCALGRQTGDRYSTRKLTDFILGLDTGASILESTPNWTRDERLQHGQELLISLSEDILKRVETEYSPRVSESFSAPKNALINNLQLDGYKYENSRLLTAESGVFDIQEKGDALATLYKDLALANSEVAFNHLSLSDTAYIAGRWSDCISNSRSFHQAVLQEVAASYSRKFENSELSKNIYDNAGPCRDYLLKVKLINDEEKRALSAVFGLLSDTGSHPYIAESDQARLLRQMALILSEFVMLRYQSRLAQKN